MTEPNGDEAHIRRLGPVVFDMRVNFLEMIQLLLIVAGGIYWLSTLDAQVDTNARDIKENRAYIERVEQRALARDEKIVDTIEGVRAEIRDGFNRLADKLDRKADK